MKNRIDVTNICILMLCMVALIACENSDDSDNNSNENSENGTDGSEDYPEPDKIVALTFDDGPEKTKTNQVLDRLEAYDVTASFFVIGQKIGGSTKETLERAVALGCDIENHSYGYDSLSGKSAEEIETSINDTTAAIEEFAGVRPHFFRPPNLAVSSIMYDTIPYPFITGITANDWESSATAESISSKILSGVKDGTIILLHDNQPMNPHPTIEALDTIIPELKKAGYEIVTVSELFERKGVDPASKTNAMWKVVE